MATNVDDYSTLLVMQGFAAFEAEVNATIAALEAFGTPQRAAAVRVAYTEYLVELEAIAQRIAQLAHTEIVHAERASRVRPDTGGGGGPRMEDHLGFSDAIPELPGSVAINQLSELDDNGVEWWWTSEWGYSGHVGREIHGWFFDSGFTSRSRPDPGQAGVHPLFMPSRSGGKGTIQEPIPERGFTRQGARVAEVEWHREVRGARQRFMAKVNAAQARP
jgi:hypothetical protein